MQRAWTTKTNQFETRQTRTLAYNSTYTKGEVSSAQTHLCKVEVQFSEQSLVLKLPAIANPQNVTNQL